MVRLARAAAGESRQRGRWMAGLQGYAFVPRFVKIRRLFAPRLPGSQPMPPVSTPPDLHYAAPTA